MKRFLVFLSLAFFVVGCRSFPVVIKDDPFTKGLSVTADMWHDVSDGNITNMRAYYTKNIKNGVSSIPELKLEFQGYFGASGYIGEKLENNVDISAGDKSFNLKFIDTTYKEMRQIHSSSSSSADSSGFRSSSSMGEWHYCILTGTIKLTPDIQKAILNGDKYLIRVYAGKTPTTLVASSKQLDAVKKFMAADAASIKKK
jgi:hypothetical protein